MSLDTTPRQYLGDRKPYSPLKVVRTAQGLSQHQLATAAGISRQRLGELEAGKGQPRLNTALALAKVLRVEVADLWPQLHNTHTTANRGEK